MRRQQAINQLTALGFEMIERQSYYTFRRGELEVSIRRGGLDRDVGAMPDVMQAIRKVEKELAAKRRAAPPPEIQIVRDRAIADLTRVERQLLDDEIRAGTPTPEISEVLQLNPQLIDQLRFRYKQVQPIEEEKEEPIMQTTPATAPKPAVLPPSLIEEKLGVPIEAKVEFTDEFIIITQYIPKRQMSKKLLASLLD